jgi:hypothetical protein
MTSPDRLDPPTFTGCFAYLEADIPPGMTLLVWRSQRPSSDAKEAADPGGSSGGAGAGADLAPEGRTLRVLMRAHRPRSGRGPSPRRIR